MPKKPFRVGRSKTGLGLFATQPIKKRAFIVQYTGPRLGNKVADERDEKGNRYLFTVNSRWTVDGSTRRNVARYANHGCRPNAESDVVKGKIIIRAIRNINPGDEITYDYGKDHFNSYIKPKGCKCAACMRKRQRERAEARALARRRRQRLKSAAKRRNGTASKRNGAASKRNGA